MTTRWQTRRAIRFAQSTVRRVRGLIALFPERYPAPLDAELTEAAAALEADAVRADDPKALKAAARTLSRRVDGAAPILYRRSFLETVYAFLIAFVLMIVIRTALIQAYKIPSGSMRPGLVPGDQIVAYKLPYGAILPFTSIKFGGWERPARGEVFVFQHPKNPHEDLIKRVIAVPGDTVAVKGGRPVVNGKTLDWKKAGAERTGPRNARVWDRYIESQGDRSYPIFIERRGPGKLRDMDEVRVSEGHYFFMGDNRDNSLDGRKWGLVDYRMVRGKALVIYLPGEDWSRFWARVR